MQSLRRISQSIVSTMVSSKVAQQQQERVTETQILRDLCRIHDDNDQIGRDAIAQIPTFHLPKTGPMRPVSTRPMLLLDERGRAYTFSTDSMTDTLTLIKDQIRRFVDHEGRYPEEILLSPLRYLAKGNATHWLIPQFGLSIPLLFERSTSELFNFEILVRGKAK